MTDKVSTEEFIDAVIEGTLSEEMFENLDLQQRGFLSNYHKDLYEKLSGSGQALSEQDFLALAADTKNIDIEKYHMMSDRQKKLFKKLDVMTYEKMEKLYDSYTVEDFEKLGLNEQQTMHKANPKKYRELQEEMQELRSKRGELMDESQAYYRMMKVKGMNDENLKVITELMQKPITAKYHVKFDKAVRQVLSEDPYTLKTMTKEEFRGKIENTFRSMLPLSVFDIQK